MSRLLVNAPSGLQEVIEIGEGGGYFDESRVLWDERADGPLPDITLGGMTRIDGSPAVEATEDSEAVDAVPARLEFDQAAFDAQPVIGTTPTEVTALQGLLALHEAGYSDDYEAWADSSDRTFVEKAFISKALIWHKNSPVIAAACVALEISDEQLNQLFELAATL